MRKYMALFMVLVLLCGILAGCGDSKKTGSGNVNASKGDAAAKEYSVTVTPPEGWTAFTDNSTLLRYRHDSGSGDFWVKQGLASDDLETRISDYKERENEGGYDITWEDVKDAKVGGMDAKYLKYTVDTGSLKMRYDAYFIQKDNALFTVICLTMQDSDYTNMESDYKALLDSLAITAK